MSSIAWAELGESLLRLGLAFAAGALVGWEREVRDRPAGFRTHVLVSLGSCLLMMISREVAGGTWDPGRVAAQVVTGIGFLGAGTIIRSGSTVRGLTTAASLWMTSAIGLAAGLGMYFLTVVFTLVQFATLTFFRRVEERFGVKAFGRRRLVATVVGDNLNIETLRAGLAAQGCAAFRFEFLGGAEGQGPAELEIDLLAPVHQDPEGLLEFLRGQPGVSEARWASLADRLGAL